METEGKREKGPVARLVARVMKACRDDERLTFRLCFIAGLVPQAICLMVTAARIGAGGVA